MPGNSTSDPNPLPVRLQPAPDRHFVTALARGLQVLACFRSSDKTLGNLEIAQRCQLPKSTVSRLTSTLTRLGYLNNVDASGKYRLGSATLALGTTMLMRLDVRQIARPLMQELADFAKAEVSLGTRDRLSMIYVENCRGAGVPAPSLDVGSRIALATSAMGRAWIAAASDKERGAALDQIRARNKNSWLAIESGLARALQDYRSLGVSCSFGDWQHNVNAIGRALQPGDGLAPMVINCGGPALTLVPEFLLHEVRPRLLDIASRIEALLRR